MYGYIYRTVNLLNNKSYIGKHKSIKFEPEKYIGSGKYLTYAIKKYGKHNFECFCIEWCETEEELNQREIYWINYYDAINSDLFYNIGKGGDGFSHKGHISIIKEKTQKFVKEEDLQFYLDQGWVKKGITPSQETINKRVEGMKGKKHPTAGAKISQKTSGLKRSEDIKLKMSESHKGIKAHNKGKIAVSKNGELKYIFPEELDYYLSLDYQRFSYKHKVIGKGVKNKIRITNNVETIYILKEDLPQWENKGYYPGAHFNMVKDKISITNGKINKKVSKEDLENYLSQGFNLGITHWNKKKEI